MEPAGGTSYANVAGNGNVRLTTGSLTRWFGTAGLPIAANVTATNGLTSQGFFPVSYGPSNRNVSVFFSAANGLGAGGTITVTHNALTGTSAVSPGVTDGVYTINTRTNASWSFSTGNLLTLNTGASFGIKATAGNLVNPININQLRLTHVNAAPGANGGGGGSAPNFTAARTGLLGTDLTGSPWYFGVNSADIYTGASGVYTQVTTGSWTTASNWDVNAVPAATSLAVINPGVVSTVSSASCVAKSLTVLGTLNNSSSSNILNIDSSFVNNGAVNIIAGTLKVNSNNTASQLSAFANVGIYNYGNFILNGGIVGIGMGTLNGGNKPFENYGGLSVGTGSTLNINGNFASLGGSYFTQSGGSITVDGNTGETNLVNQLAHSVPHGRALFSLQTPSIHFYGGNVTIVDPPADTTYLNPFSGLPAAFEFVVPAGTPMFNDSSAHTFTFGNGISADAGGNSRGFLLMTTGSGVSSLFNFSNLVINGAAGTNRAVTTYYTGIGVQNAMTINSGGEYQLSSRDLVLNGSLTVNSGGKLTSDNAGTLTFGQLQFVGSATAIAPAAPTLANQPQRVTGNGIFVNGATNTANLGNIKTLSPPFVVFNTGSTLSFPSTDVITFVPQNNVPSRIIMTGGALAENGGASSTSNNASATNGWVVGTYQKHANIGSMGSGNFKYPIGDSNNYTPVSISGTGINVVSAGDIAVSTTPSVASTLSFSSFNPLKLINRTYAISTSPTLVTTPNSIGVSFTFVPGDITPSANYQNFKVGVNPTGTAWYYPHSTGQAATSIAIDSLAPTGLAGLYQIGEACPKTVITTQPQSTGGCIGGLPVTFTVAATGASLQYQWFHNNVAIPSANNTTYTRQTPTASDSGLYYVVITGACALPDTSNKVTFSIGGASPILAQPLSQGVCDGYPLTLCVTALNAGTYRWQKNNVDLGNQYQNAPCITINSMNALDTGRYRVIIGNGCANDTSLTAYVNIHSLPTATISTTTPLAFCNGNNVLLTANGTAFTGYTYQWNLDGTPIPGATNQVYSATNAGNYSVVVTDVNSCPSTSVPDSVTVFSSPVVNVFPLSSTTFCAGGSVGLQAVPDPTFTYQWQLNGTSLTGATQDSFRATTSGNYSVAVTNLNNCTYTSAATLVTSLPVPSGPIAASGSTAICSNSSVTLTAPSGAGYTYQWYNNGVAIPGANLISYNANAAGLYNVVVISNSYCIDTASPVNVTQFPLPGNIINTSGPTTFCQGGSVILSAGTGPGVTYQWQLNGLNLSTTTDSLIVSPTTAGTYSYSVTIGNSAGCTETPPAVNVTVNSSPTPVITGNGTGGLSAQAGFSSYQWYLNGTAVPANGNTNTYTAATGGDYTVYVTSGNGCGNMSAVYHYSSSGVSSVANNQNVRIYPNPARDIVYIDAPFAVNVSVNSVDGKELFSQASAKSINIAALANGIYMIRISDADGNLVSVEKLVKSDN
ncbi:MAG: T9SS type A sorting domain-containing protein, partial [Flavipsychrobacter sp.]|nr:T9SS type A sorting domain-containing protein [Flavipsychrobacter sp.]